MYKFNYFGKVKEYETLEELVDCRCDIACLEQQRSFGLSSDDEYDEDDYDPIYCQICGDDCKDLYGIEGLVEIYSSNEQHDICSQECLIKQLEMMANNNDVKGIWIEE